MSKPLIGLLDCNNFFVSCERLFRPDLLGRPVIVLSSNDGCVVARSQEVKDIGVEMGVPYFKIKDTVKEHGIATFSSHFALYRDISRRVFAVMKRELEVVEQYSVDEAFFIINKDHTETVVNLKSTIEKLVGIPVSVGVGASKTQAKYASELAKKGSGIKVLTPIEWNSLADSIPLGQLWGVGGKSSKRYKQHNLFTVSDILNADSGRIAQLFGVNGIRLQQELLGDLTPKIEQKHAPQQSITSSRSFANSVTELSILYDAVAYHVRHAAADLRAQKQNAGKIIVSIRPGRYGDFVLRGGSKEAVFTSPTNDTVALMTCAEKLVCDLYEKGVPYKKVGITLSLLRPVGERQTALFADQTPEAGSKLLAAVDILNQKVGKEVVLFGSRLQTKKWQSRSASQSPSYTTNWKDIATAQAS